MQLHETYESELIYSALFTQGMLHGLVGFCFDVVCCRFKLGVYRPREVSVHLSLLLFICYMTDPES